MTTIQVRWMIRRDMAEVLEIEHLCQRREDAWSEDEFLRNLRRSDCVGKIVEYHGQIVAFTVYENAKRSIEIFNLAVHPSCWRRGFGSLLLDHVRRGLSLKRPVMSVEVPERQLAAQLFLRHHGFTMQLALKDDSGAFEDLYFFVYEIGTEAPVTRVLIAE